MGTGSQGSHERDGMDWRGLNNAEPCHGAAAAESSLPLNPALNRFRGQKVKTPERCLCLGLKRRGSFQD